jgi:rSAM/selenodomain-associated transferase 2
MPASVSIIIPTLDAADDLPATAEALLSGATEGLVRELVVSDGGSTDGTRHIAGDLGATVIRGARGRGGQIARGVEAASGDWLLILHADTHPAPGWTAAVRAHIADHPENAGYFDLAFRAAGLGPWLVARAANVRSRLLWLPYGDQGLVISRALFDKVGGMPVIPLMEDVELARRLKGRLRPLGVAATTSAARYDRDGWLNRSARNLGTLLRYKLGASPESLVRRYENKP